MRVIFLRAKHGTTLTSLSEVHLNHWFLSFSPPAPSPGLGDAPFTSRRNDSNVLLCLVYLQDTTVGGLLFGISAAFCYFSRPFAKAKKNEKKRIPCFAFLYLLPFKAPGRSDEHPLVLSQAAGGWTQPLRPHRANTPRSSPGVAASWDAAVQLQESSRCAATECRQRQPWAEQRFHLLLQTRAAGVSCLILLRQEGWTR